MASRVGVEQQLVRVEAVALIQLARAVYAIAIDRTGRDTRQVAVPDLIGVFGKLDTRGLALALLVEEADLHPGRVRREQGEIDALTVPRRTERMRQAFPDLDFVH